MSIATEIQRLQTAKSDLKTSIENKGVTVPSTATLDEYSDYVDQITGGGGGDDKFKYLVDGSISGTITANDLSGITNIRQYCFYGCNSITSIQIPEGVTRVNDHAFDNCLYLSAITIPNTVNYLGPNTFSYCRRLESITIPSGVTSASNYLMQYAAINTTNGADITFEGVKGIGLYAFRGSKINTLTFETPVTGHSNSWLQYTTANTLNIGGTIFTGTSATANWLYTTIGNNADRTRFQIKNINILDGTTSIGSFTFYSGLSITSIDMTAATGLTSIGNYAFAWCTGMTSCSIPNSVTGLGISAFSNCHSLQSINIPTGLTQIPNTCFQNCRSLTAVTVPSSVTSVGATCFSGSSALTYVRFTSTTPPTLGGSGVFAGTNSCPIYVPSDAVEAYKNADVWSGWADRIEAWMGD